MLQAKPSIIYRPRGYGRHGRALRVTPCPPRGPPACGPAKPVSRLELGFSPFLVTANIFVPGTKPGFSPAGAAVRLCRPRGAAAPSGGRKCHEVHDRGGHTPGALYNHGLHLQHPQTISWSFPGLKEFIYGNRQTQEKEPPPGFRP